MRHGVAVALTVLAAVLWGTSFLVNDAGVRLVHPAAFSFWRFAIAAVASVAVAIAARAFDPRIYRDPVLWALGAISAAGFLSQYVAQTLTTPARTALFVNSNVLVVALLSWIALRQPPRARTLAAMAIALVGVVLLQSGELAGGSPLGDLLAFLCGTCGALMFVLFPGQLRKTNAWNLMAGIFVGTALFTLPFAAAASWTAPVPPAVSWPAILYSAIATSTIAYTVWAFTMHRLTPTTSAVLLLLEVLVAAALSVSIGRETVTWLAASGAVLLLAGVVWLSVPPRAERAGS